MNPDPLTDEELQRVLELEKQMQKPKDLESALSNLPTMGILSDLCPRIARELIAARAVIENAKAAFGAHPESDIDLSEWIGELRDAARKPFHESTESIREKDQLRAQIATDAEKLRIAREAIEQIKAMAVNRVAPVYMPRRVQLGSYCQHALAQLTPKP
jgi:hypothetical protein